MVNMCFYPLLTHGLWDVFWCFDIRGGRHYHASDLGNWLGVGPQVSQGAAMLSERWATQKKVVDTSNL